MPPSDPTDHSQNLYPVLMVPEVAPSNCCKPCRFPETSVAYIWQFSPTPVGERNDTVMSLKPEISSVNVTIGLTLAVALVTSIDVVERETA
eukprot:3087049-Prymnesium_polylepis.1